MFCAVAPEKLHIVQVLSAEMLRLFGVPVNTRGYYFLKRCIVTVVYHPIYAGNLSRFVLPSLAKEFDTPIDTIAQSMRRALERGWLCTEETTLLQFFAPEFRGEKYWKPTNAVFIATIAEHVRNHMEEM
jgi:hypothetical protein